jgi:hypothetical protein
MRCGSWELLAKSSDRQTRFSSFWGMKGVFGHLVRPKLFEEKSKVPVLCAEFTQTRSVSRSWVDNALEYFSGYKKYSNENCTVTFHEHGKHLQTQNN